MRVARYRHVWRLRRIYGRQVSSPTPLQFNADTYHSRPGHLYTYWRDVCVLQLRQYAIAIVNYNSDIDTGLELMPHISALETLRLWYGLGSFRKGLSTCIMVVILCCFLALRNEHLTDEVAFLFQILLISIEPGTELGATRRRLQRTLTDFSLFTKEPCVSYEDVRDTKMLNRPRYHEMACLLGVGGAWQGAELAPKPRPTSPPSTRKQTRLHQLEDDFTKAVLNVESSFAAAIQYLLAACVRSTGRSQSTARRCTWRPCATDSFAVSARQSQARERCRIN